MSIQINLKLNRKQVPYMIALSLFKGGFIYVAVLINEQIKADEVVLTGLAGEKLGVVSKSEALAILIQRGGPGLHLIDEQSTTL